MIRLAAAAAAAALASAPVQGSVFGPVVAVTGGAFTITTSLSPSGKSIVTVGSAKITAQATAPRSALKVGACVAATGTRSKAGVVAAQRIEVTQSVKGTCARGGAFPVRRGTRPNLPRTSTTPRFQPPPGGFGGNANFGFASGQVTKVSGSTLTVKGRSFRSTKTTTTTVTVSSKTALQETKSVGASAITTSECAFVDGTSADKGKTVKATTIALTPKTNGTCNAGFNRRAGP